MNRQDFFDLLGIKPPTASRLFNSSELERPLTKNTLEFEIATYLQEARLNRTKSFSYLQGRNITVISAWSRGILFLDEDPIEGKTFIFLYLGGTNSPEMEVWTNHDEDPLLPVWSFTEEALAELVHPKIATEYMALASAEAETKRLKREAERTVIVEKEKKAKIARLATLKAEMKTLEAEIKKG
jgi:hypothetical protein